MKNINIKLIQFFLIAVIAAGCASSKKTSEEDEKKEEVPAVEAKKETKKIPEFRIVENWMYDYNSGVQEKSGKKISSVKYDEDDNMVETLIFNGSEIAEKYRYAYDEKGNRIETIKYNAAGNVEKRFSYEYDTEGRKIRTLEYKTNGALDKKYEYEYDENDNMVEETWYSSKGDMIQRFIYVYRSGRKVEGYNYSPDNKLFFKYEYKYDGLGNLVKEIRYNPSGQPLGVVESVYK